MLIDAEKIRYSRQILLNQFGLDAQEKLKAAKVLVTGAGGLGSPLLAYLAAAGVGHIGIIDDDIVDLSNLQRQLIHDTDKIGEFKAFSAQEAIDRINPHVEVETWATTLKSLSIDAIIKQYNLVAVAVDNFSTRSLINKSCIKFMIPQIYGAAVEFNGYVGMFKPWLKDSPCFRCLYPQRPQSEALQSAAEIGVLSTLCGIIGTIQANEIIKEITNTGKRSNNEMLWINALELNFKSIKVPKNPDCPYCSSHIIKTA